jgi:hypothetical protein
VKRRSRVAAPLGARTRRRPFPLPASNTPCLPASTPHRACPRLAHVARPQAPLHRASPTPVRLFAAPEAPPLAGSCSASSCFVGSCFVGSCPSDRARRIVPVGSCPSDRARRIV